MKQDYILKIIIPEFPQNKKEMKRVTNYLHRIATEFENESDLKIYKKKNLTLRLMKNK